MAAVGQCNNSESFELFRFEFNFSQFCTVGWQ